MKKKLKITFEYDTDNLSEQQMVDWLNLTALNAIGLNLVIGEKQSLRERIVAAIFKYMGRPS